MVADRIEREIVLQWPIERVWAALTEAEHIARWFAFDGAQVDLRPGGAILFRWKEHGEFHALIEAVEAPRFFSYRWSLLAGEKPRAGNSTLVEFTLERAGRSTRLRVVESGFASLDVGEAERRTHLESNRQGWAGAFEQLEGYVAQATV